MQLTIIMISQQPHSINLTILTKEILNSINQLQWNITNLEAPHIRINTCPNHPHTKTIINLDHRLVKTFTNQELMRT
jgi:hypothetical protein